MNLFDELKNLLVGNPIYTSEEGILLKNKVVESALQLNPELLKLLLFHDGMKANFFAEVDGITVFDKVKFQKFVSNKQFLPDSYTSFKNKIGLTTDEGDFLSDSKEVVLSWPYKDCVLEGGQTKEDAKRNEIFWNEILAPDEITRLKEPKALANFKRYDRDGELAVDTISMNDNLIIKGNNLLALHSLKKKYAGKIKLIYIDPPYNTGNDGFQYNDSFNHSSWLTFMRNRLQVAKKLLKSNGVIFIQIDENELGYLKPIADEIFGRENFEIQINWQRTTQRSVLGQGATPIINIVEYILVYKKESNAEGALNKIQKIIPSNDKMYNQYNLLLKTEGQRELVNTLQHNGSEIRFYKHSNFILESIPSKERTEEKYIELFQMIVRKDSQQQESSLEQIIMENIDNNDILYSVERILKQGKNKGELKKSFYMNNNVIYYLKEYADVVENKIFRKVDMNNIWLDYEISSAGIAEEGNVKLKRGKKPEGLIQRIIEIGTNNESDIVLDYHLGSGTTCAVAHKMGRRFIGIEQMDYGENDSVVRLQNVIGRKVKDGLFDKTEFDQSGISKVVNWKGGGSFVYCELSKANQQFADQILNTSTKDALQKLWAEIQKTGFISWKIDIKSINENAALFDELEVDDMKRFLLEALDKNLLYVPYSDMDNADYNVSDEDKRLNRMFYEAK